MSDQPPYGYPPPGGGYPPPGGYQGGGYPPPPPTNKTKVLGLDYNVAAMLCYLPTCLCCIVLIPTILFLATEPKESRFMRFHALQGLIFCGIWIVLSIIFRILGAGAQFSSGFGTGGAAAGAGAGLLVGLLSLVVFLGFLILSIVGMVKAYQGQMWKMPLIGDIAEKNA
jgi:uncharacterized membrane protein